MDFSLVNNTELAILTANYTRNDNIDRLDSAVVEGVKRLEGMTVFDKILNTAVHYIVDYKKDQDRLEKSISAQNDGKTPVVGSDGRLHAPCTGYVWNESVYMGGQYLNIESNKEAANCKVRLKTSTEKVLLLSKVLGKHFTINHGKTWTDKDTGLIVTYCYLEGLTESQKKGLNKLIPTGGKRLVSEDDAKVQGITLGTTWKVNNRGISQAWRTMSEGYFLHYLEDKGLVYSDVKITDKKVTLLQAGKICGYHYLSDLVC